MTDSGQEHYAILDRPDVLRFLFHPRRDDSFRQPGEHREDLLIPLEDDTILSASFHHAAENKDGPVILFFHGNGEIANDYDEFGRFYTQMGIHFFVVDYRGYGSSTGRSTVSAMMTDCHAVLDYLAAYKKRKGYHGPVCLMGRSLGSAPAIELASKRTRDISCLIVESGFAYAGPLLETLGIQTEKIGYNKDSGVENIDKIKQVSRPCLVIHAENDQVISFSEGQALFDAAGSARKFFLEVKGADHNDIFIKGMTPYLEHIRSICFL
jgi:alpha-beta hydrolase superfamily lysophospholipase